MECIPGSVIQDHSLLLFLGHIATCILMQGVCNLGEVLNKVPVVPNKSNKTLNDSVHGRFGVFCDGSQVILLGHNPFKETLCPRFSNCSLKNSHLEGLSFSLWSQKCSNIAHKCMMCSSHILK